jgi:chromosome partitioning protein
MSQILLLINLKGGVAKTTNAVAIAECLASKGYRTLMIDADHQCTASELLLGVDRLFRAENRRMTLHDLLAAMLDDDFHERQIAKYRIENVSNIDGGLRNLSMIPCSFRIDDFSTNMAKARRGYKSTEEFQEIYNRRRRLMQTWLKANADFTIIDCPPSMALQVKFFLKVADGFVVPSVPDRLSVRGSLHLLDRIDKMGFGINPIGTLWSLYREQNHVHRNTVKLTEEGVGDYKRLPCPFQTVIPNATVIADSTENADSSNSHTVPSSFRAKYSSKFAKLFEELCEEIIARTEWGRSKMERATPARVVAD